MAKRKNPSRVNIPMCAAGVLLCLTLFSAHVTSGLYAKYTATATGSDSARVAKFDVKTDGTDENIEVTTSQNEGEYTITIKNDSEVAVRYELSVTDLTQYGVTSQFDKKTGDIAVNGSDACTITFKVTDWAQFTKDAYNTDKLEKDLSFTVNIHVEQID